MKETGHPKHMRTLAAQLEHKLEQDRATIMEMTSKELAKLANGLKTSTGNALDTTGNDIMRNLETMRTRVLTDLNLTEQTIEDGKRALRLSWLAPALIGTTLLLFTWFGGWALMLFQSEKRQALQTQHTELEMAINQQKQTLEALNPQTLGIQLKKDKQGIFLVLPEGMSAETDWTSGDQRAIRLTRR